MIVDVYVLPFVLAVVGLTGALFGFVAGWGASAKVRALEDERRRDEPRLSEVDPIFAPQAPSSPSAAGGG